MHKSSFEVLSKKKSRSSHRFRKITTVLYDICKIEWRNGHALDSSPEDWGFDSLFFYCRLKAIVLLSIFLSLSPSLLKRNYVIIQEATQEILASGSTPPAAGIGPSESLPSGAIQWALFWLEIELNCDLLKSILHLTLLIMTVVEIRFFSLLFFKEELLLFAALSSASLRELVHHRVQTPQPVHRAFSGFQLPGGGCF